MSIDAREGEILAWLDDQHEPMVELLRAIVDIDSGSYNKAGVDQVGTVLRRHFEQHGITCEMIESKPVDGTLYGDCIKAVVPAANGVAAPVILLGHRDTVFPDGTVAERPFQVQGDRAYGPGVADMKAGLVMNAFVLAAFARFGGASHPLIGLYTSDEEIASPSSRPVIEATAKGARAVFNAEPGRVPNGIVRGRKGALFFSLETTGRSAHSGAAHDKGVSAIEELCRKVLDLHALTDYESGTTVNVGLLEGGVSVNTVAPAAKARVDVRFKTMPAMAAAEAAIEAIAAKTYLDGTTTTIADKAAFLPLEQSEASQALFDHYVACAGDLGMSVSGEYTGGSADSGFTAAVGAPTVCGTGPVGEKAHSPAEVCHLETLTLRAKAVALAILRLD